MSKAFQGATNEATGYNQAQKDLADYTNESFLSTLSNKEQALAREKASYEELRKEIIRTGGSAQDLLEAEMAYLTNLRTINKEHDEKIAKSIKLTEQQMLEKSILESILGPQKLYEDSLRGLITLFRKR